MRIEAIVDCLEQITKTCFSLWVDKGVEVNEDDRDL